LSSTKPPFVVRHLVLPEGLMNHAPYASMSKQSLTI